jgi:hypothetical protein
MDAGGRATQEQLPSVSRRMLKNDQSFYTAVPIKTDPIRRETLTLFPALQNQKPPPIKSHPKVVFYFSITSI